MSATYAVTALRHLQRLKLSFDPESEHEKLRLLQVLERAHLQSAQQVIRLHDLMCFMQAYPDSEAVLIKVERMLGDFANRKDLKHHRRRLADTGIVGTVLHFRFYWPTARWLFERWPGSISINWAEWDAQHTLDELWPLLLSYPATEALESLSLSPQQWIKALKRPEETDAAFLIRHFIRWRVEDRVRETLYDELDIPLLLSHGIGTPSRTYSRHKPRKMNYGLAPWQLLRPIAKLVKRVPLAVHGVSEGEGKQLIDLARTQMITRGRDLYAFMNADPKDVRIISCDNGLQFVCYGLLPERRSLVEAIYVFLILRNGVPIGYTQAATLLQSAEINFNVFDVFRGAETSRIFVYTLAMVHHLFRADAFVINTQQLGEDNPEALKSGAFWFYYKHGFRPLDSEVKRMLRGELERKRKSTNYRSSVRMLKQLARSELALYFGRSRKILVNSLATENIGLMAARVLEAHASTARSNGAQRCLRLATSLLDYRPDRRWSHATQLAWQRWSPIVLALPGLAKWSASSRRALVDVINAKGGRRESDFVILFDRHKPLKTALLKLAKTHPY